MMGAIMFSSAKETFTCKGEIHKSITSIRHTQWIDSDNLTDENESKADDEGEDVATQGFIILAISFRKDP